MEALAGLEAGKDRARAWQPWQFNPLELFQAVAVSTPSRQHLAQEYLIVCVQSGTADVQYRNTRISGDPYDCATTDQQKNVQRI